MSKYTYYVVYTHQTHIIELGYGCCFVTRNKPLKDNNDLLELQNTIEKENNFEKVVIINFKRMEFKGEKND